MFSKSFVETGGSPFVTTTPACLAGHPLPDPESPETSDGNVIMPDYSDGYTGGIKSDPIQRNKHDSEFKQTLPFSYPIVPLWLPSSGSQAVGAYRYHGQAM